MWSLYLGSSTRDFLVECVGKSHSSKMRRVLESASHRVCTLVVAVQFSVVSSEVLVNQAGRVEGVVVMIATEPQREVLVPIKRVKRATADKKIVVAATRDELKAMRKLEEPIPDTRADQL